MKKRNNNIEEYIKFKIITLGDSLVGKTSIIKRYLENKFTYESTLTVGFIKSKKKIILKNNIFRIMRYFRTRKICIFEHAIC